MKKDMIKTGTDNARAAIVMYLLREVSVTINNSERLLGYKVLSPHDIRVLV